MTFAFSYVGLTSIHRRIFDGIFKFAGNIRDVEITKMEFRNALVRASYKGMNVNPTTEFLEAFLRNVIMGEENELTNRSMLVCLDGSKSESIKRNVSKSQIDTLKSVSTENDVKNCTLEELAVLRLIQDAPKITQAEIAKCIMKSASTVKRITSALV